MSASIVPTTVYQVLDEIGGYRPVWREIGAAEANEAFIVEMIIEGHFHRPLCVVAFNIDEGWARDATREIGSRLLNLNRQGRVLGAAANEFVERVTGHSPITVV